VITDPARCRSRNVGKFDNNTAFENILLCASAYTDDTQSCLSRINPKGGFVVYEQIAHRCEDLPLFKYKECYAYTAVSHLKKVIVLSYRGSKSENGYQIYDELISILAKPMVPFPAGGKVQEYFFKAHTYLFPCVNSSVANLIKKYSNYRVIVTGHSLGGALASLAAASLIYQKTVSADRLTLYTFGMPRTGNKQFALIHDILVNDSWRVVHYRDIVSHLPSRNLSPLDGPFHSVYRG
jgi:predicted lipase